MTKVYSTNDEIFGAEDILDLGLEVGDKYFVGTKVEILPSELLWSIDSIVELMQDQLYDRVGEVSENFEPTEEQKDKVFTGLKSLVNDNFDIDCYAVEEIQELTYEED